jgi:hypothetical protein
LLVYLTASFKALPTLNFATFVAGTLTSAPVAGTLAVLSALVDVENVPKPMKLTLSPFESVSVIVSSTASNAAFESFLVSPDFSAFLG